MSKKVEVQSMQSSKTGKTNRRQRGGQLGNRNAHKDGAYAKHFVSELEQEAFQDLRSELAKDFKKESGADSLELDMLCLMALRHGQALEKNDIDLAIKLDTPVRNHLAALKATRASRKSKDTPNKPQTTPAEWMSDLLAEYRKLRQEGKIEK